jgi:hypothetical protein
LSPTRLINPTTSTLTASRARRSLGPAPSLAAAQYGAYPVTPGLSGYARAIQRYQRYSAIPAIFSDTSRYFVPGAFLGFNTPNALTLALRATQFARLEPVHAYRRERLFKRCFTFLRRISQKTACDCSARHFRAVKTSLRSQAPSLARAVLTALCRALNLRLRFFWGKMRARVRTFVRPRPNRFSRTVPICPCWRVGTLPKLCQIDACTVHDWRAQATPVPPTRQAMRLSGIDFAAPGRCREKTARTYTSAERQDIQRFAPDAAPGGTRQSQPEAGTARAPVRWRVSWRAHRPAYQPATALRASASRRFNPRLPGGRRPRQKPPEARTARAPSAGAQRGARTDQYTSPDRRYAPDAAQNAPDAARSPQRARSRADASQKPAPRARRPLARVVARAPTGVPARDSVTRRRFTPGTRQTPAASAYRALLRFSTITDPVRIRLRRPGIA